MIRVSKDGYIATQGTNNHFMISKDGRMVMHAACTSPMTEADLLSQIDAYIRFAKSGDIKALFDGKIEEVSDNA